MKLGLLVLGLGLLACAVDFTMASDPHHAYVHAFEDVNVRGAYIKTFSGTGCNGDSHEEPKFIQGQCMRSNDDHFLYFTGCDQDRISVIASKRCPPVDASDIVNDGIVYFYANNRCFDQSMGVSGANSYSMSCNGTHVDLPKDITALTNSPASATFAFDETKRDSAKCLVLSKVMWTSYESLPLPKNSTCDDYSCESLPNSSVSLFHMCNSRMASPSIN